MKKYTGKQIDNIPGHPLWCECLLCEKVRIVTKNTKKQTIFNKNEK